MKATILVIEDNKDMAENIAEILRLGKYSVLTAPNGKIGVEVALKEQPDLVLCDILMPELDGYSVLHLLSQDPETSSIPFIFLTAKGDTNDFRTGMNLGADDYVTKPFDGFDLLKVVEMRLKKHHVLTSTYDNNLQGVELFFNNAKEMKEFRRLSEKRHVRNAKKREFLFMEGQKINDLYFINEGKVKTYKSSSDGKELITGFHSRGDFLGYSALLEEAPVRETAVVVEDAEVAIIPGQDFLSLIYSSRDVARKFIKLLSNNLGNVEDRLLNLAYQPVRQRVAGALLVLNEGGSSNEMITISRRDISNIVGTATESLNRTLADFRDEGLVELEGHGIKILNATKIKKLAMQ
jgi:CRP-like cAMP-binding protein/CheY-like chemotaxis protein